MKSFRKTAIYTIFAAYILLMLWLLFFQRIGWVREYSYAEHFRQQTNMVPFRTFIEFIGHIRSKTGYAALSMRNLAGNIILFVPLGVLLPVIWKKQRRIVPFLLTVTASIVCVELIQLVTMLGSCDIDDLISNVMGAAIGFPLGRSLSRKHEPENCDLSGQ